jgi:hypothetical protein
MVLFLTHFRKMAYVMIAARLAVAERVSDTSFAEQAPIFKRTSLAIANG